MRVLHEYVKIVVFNKRGMELNQVRMIIKFTHDFSFLNCRKLLFDLYIFHQDLFHHIILRLPEQILSALFGAAEPIGVLLGLLLFYQKHSAVGAFAQLFENFKILHGVS